MGREGQHEYSAITEAPGLQASEEQLERLFQRYRFAVPFIKERDVLEIACGTGLGLGFLADYARRVVGIDIDDKNLDRGRKHYTGHPKVSLARMDAHNLAFTDGEFDAVLLYEAIYYLNDPERCIREIRRVLNSSGVLIICTVNREWGDFHPSPFVHRYYSARELHALLSAHFPRVELFGGFPVAPGGIRSRVLSAVKRMAVRMDLIPGSLRLRAYLKRIFVGKLVTLPDEVYNGMSLYREPERIGHDSPAGGYTILYAVASCQEDRAHHAEEVL